jgi:L-threonylcarbamoyladenylate synthase
MKPVPVTDENIARAADIIKSGGLVVFPTETVYGLGADAMNPDAVARIFEVKNRPFFDPLIVHISDISSVGELADDFDAKARALVEEFWPGPLTIVLPKSSIVPDIVTAGLQTVAIRMPSHPVALKLIERSGTTIAAPSANLFGYLSPTSAGHVESQLGGSDVMILDGGPCAVGVESTIIKFGGKKPVVLRLGGLTIEEIENSTGRVDIETESTNPEAPGQLIYHYSPMTPVRVINKIPDEIKGKRAGLLSFAGKNTAGFPVVEVLSASGDIREAAARFFGCLHRLDEAGLDMIYAEKVPEEGLGRAIMDRLIKASKRR